MFVDYPALLVKCQDIDKVLKAFNAFDKNLKITIDKFENQAPYFLDLEICLNVLKTFQKTLVLDRSLTCTSLLYLLFTC